MTRTLGEPARVAVDPPGSADGIPDLLTVALVVPCAAVAVLFLLEIDILANRETRRVLAAGVALAVPVALLALRGVEALFPRPGRAFSAPRFPVAARVGRPRRAPLDRPVRSRRPGRRPDERGSGP